jgi:hypothetical protein
MGGGVTPQNAGAAMHNPRITAVVKFFIESCTSKVKSEISMVLPGSS